MQHFQDFTPGREGAAIGALVLVHRFHENDFFVAVLLLAGGGIDLSAALAFLTPVFAAAPFNGNGNGTLPTFILLTTIPATPIRDHEIRGQAALAAHKWTSSHRRNHRSSSAPKGVARGPAKRGEDRASLPNIDHEAARTNFPITESALSSILLGTGHNSAMIGPEFSVGNVLFLKFLLSLAEISRQRFAPGPRRGDLQLPQTSMIENAVGGPAGRRGIVATGNGCQVRIHAGQLEDSAG